MVLIPTAVAASAGTVALSRGEVLVAGALVVLAAGTLIGIGCAEIAFRSAMVTLDAATAAIAHGAPAPSPTFRRFGSLVPIARRLGDVSEALRLAREEATTDRLTQVANRPTLLAQLFTEVERATRHDRSLAIAFIDLDHFKEINDTYGHEVGDAVLHDVAGVFREHTRGSDFVGRYGGEEFVLVLPETMVGEAAAVAEKVRLLILHRRFEGPQGDALRVSVSIGIAGGLRTTSARRPASARRRRGDVRGQVTRPQPDLRVRRDRRRHGADSHAPRSRPKDGSGQSRWVTRPVMPQRPPSHPYWPRAPTTAGGPPSSSPRSRSAWQSSLACPSEEIERIRVAALLHDVGKLAVPEYILEKPGPLDADEWLSVVQHPRAGDAILERVAAVGDARAIILHHHEHYSGRGYPYGLRGSDIPLGARIVAVADAYDAMVRDRPYRSAISHDAAVAELRRYARVQFDPELVDLFCDLYGFAAPRADRTLLIRPQAMPAAHTAPPARGNAASA